MGALGGSLERDGTSDPPGGAGHERDEAGDGRGTWVEDGGFGHGSGTSVIGVGPPE